MTQYDPSYPRSANTDSADGLLTASDRLDDRAHSLSGSDDGGSGIHKVVDTEIEEDVTLTSQTLNADGTPKRPMNAFMIFARRRRPQVSAENQSMRTGEISKLLSKEWTTMPTSEKQFYLDQAKILKENFNSKYPDYVYRRRPNNTRKKNRRGDIAGLRQLDNAQLDDLAGAGGHSELGESSHTDEESSSLDPNGPYSRMPPPPPHHHHPHSHHHNPHQHHPQHHHHDVSQAYDTHGRYTSLPSRYPPPTATLSSTPDGFRHTPHDARLPSYHPDRLQPQDLTAAATSRLGAAVTSYTYPPYNTASTTSPSLYDTVTSTSPESWQQHKLDRAGGGACWPNTTTDRLLSISQAPPPPPKMDPSSSSPYTTTSSTSPHNSNNNPTSSWHTSTTDHHHPTSNGSSSTAAGAAGTTGAGGSNSYPFQALTTPFTPNHQGGGGGGGVTGYSSSPSPAPYNTEPPSQHHGGSRDYDSRPPYAPSPSISPASYPPPSNRTSGGSGMPYPARQASISRTVVPGISSFNHPGMQPPPPETSASHAAYWSRE